MAGGLKPAYYHNEPNAKAPVITISASGANAGYVALYLNDIWASDCSYISIGDNPHIWFWYETLRNRQVEITSLQQGAAQPHVYPKHLARLKVVMPPLELLMDYQASVDGVFALIRNLEEQSTNLVTMRDLLLPKLMNRQLSV